MLRITVNGQRAEISVKRKVDLERWDSNANRIRGTKEDAKEVNSLIDLLTLMLNKIYSKLVENEETITARKVKDIYLGKDVKKKSLLEVFALHNEMMRSRVGVDFSRSTFTQYSTTYDHIIQFLKQDYNLNDSMLKDIPYSFITDFEHFLKVTRKCNHNSSQKYIRVGVGVRFDQKTYSILKELVQQTNCHSVGELIRRIIVKNKIRFYSIDTTVDIPMLEIIKIKEELNAIGEILIR